MFLCVIVLVYPVRLGKKGLLVSSAFIILSYMNLMRTTALSHFATPIP